MTDGNPYIYIFADQSPYNDHYEQTERIRNTDNSQVCTYQTLYCRSYHQEIDGDKQNVPGKHHEDTPVKVCIHPRLNDPRGSSVGIASVYVLISWMVVLLIKPDSRVKDYQSLIHNRLA